MKIEHNQIDIGSRIRLKEDVEMFNITYTKGHEFNVVGQSYRGFDLVDDDGNRMDETLFISHLLEPIESQPYEKKYTEEDIQKSYKKGWQDGWSDGHDIGYSRGVTDEKRR